VTMECVDLSCGYNKTAVLEQINFSVNEGEILCVLGANGEGKSTLFKTLLGLIPAIKGQIRIDDENTLNWSSRKLAKYIGYIPQTLSTSFSYTVRDMILMGRTAYLKPLSNPNESDMDIVLKVMEEMNIEELSDKNFFCLSGGEKQLVIIARALAQEPKIMIMDEPTNALDFSNQQLVLDRIRELKRRNLAIIMASHFPDHAFQCADRVMMLKDGKIFGQGDCSAVLTENNLKQLYGIDTKIIHTGMRYCPDGKEIKVCVAFNNKVG